MTTHDREPKLPVGAPVAGWTPRPRPARIVLEGRYCRVEPLDAARHAGGLFEANGTDREGRMWNYLAYGPFATFAEYHERLLVWQSSEDPLFCAIVDRSGDRAVGIGSYLRIDVASGVIEVGHLQYSPVLQRTRAATEAMYLMMRQVFELGYRRYEWKCDSLNAASRRAAERLGFRFEGVFRQAMVYKGRNRDTAWYSIIDREWPAVAAGFEAWLAPANFDAAGKQRSGLAELRQQAGAGMATE